MEAGKKQKILYLVMLTSLSLLFAVGCGKKGQSNQAETPKATPPNGGKSQTPAISFAGKNIALDSSVPSDQAEMLREDFKSLQSLSFSSEEDAKLFGLPTLSNQTLSTWITDRIKFIVGEDYDSASLAKGSSYEYSPKLIAKEIEESQVSKMTTVMSNTGAYVYLKGKEYDALFTLPINGTPVAVRSPRVGIIKIGPGLFTVNRIQSSQMTSLANILVRMGTIVHEARHSDGNGATTAFPHAECTINGAKSHACENNLNGPYMLEAKFLKLARKICQKYSCTTEEQEGLKVFQADSESRLRGNNMPDPRPEGI